MPRSKAKVPASDSAPLKMYLVPCSCGTPFAVPENYDRQGTGWSRYLKCPSCGKRHDPKNRSLQLGYQRARILEGGPVLRALHGITSHPWKTCYTSPRI